MIIMDLPHLDGYDWGSKIGGGSFSSVYKATIKNPEKTPVAIKCISRNRGKKINNDAAVKEISLMKDLKHENIVKLYDFQFDSKHIYLIMEICTEGDLSMLIRQKYKLFESFMQMLMQQLASALRYLRTKNICHMDLKPQNILLTRIPELVLKLGDFGLSSILNEENIEQSRFAGSFRYMAPEKLLNQKFDSRVDLWSVGIIMYECLVGRTPFGNAPLKVIVDHMTQQNSIQIPISVTVSDSCDNLLHSLLKYNPAARITFENFFEHSFLKLNLLPSAENYDHVKELIEEAKVLEKDKEFSAALKNCKDGILFLEAFSFGESNPDKKRLVSQKLNEYKRWSEQLAFLVGQAAQGTSKAPVISSENQYQYLHTLCKATPHLQSALEIGRVAEMYVLDGKKDLALEKITAALDTIIQLISNEPAGFRKDLLYKQIQQWLLLGETLKKSLQ